MWYTLGPMAAPHVAIVAGTLTGNRGAEAMVSTCIEQVRKRYPDAVVHVLSYYPEDDAREPVPPNVFVHSATPLRIVTNWVPGALLARVVPGLRRRLKGPGAGILSLLSVDALLDVAGVAFVDGREKFLPFNVLTLLPFMINGVKVYKLAQAVGPFTSATNRIAARLVLPYLRFVGARGAVTERHLRDFGLDAQRCTLSPDITFLHDPEESTPYEARPKRVGIIPSSLVRGKNPEYATLLARVADGLVDNGYQVVMIVHSYRSGSDKPRNNDLPVAREVARLARHGSSFEIVGEGLNSLQIKAEVGRCRAVLTSRFHGMVAALGTSTPVVVVGWSHKYREVLDMFGLAESCFDYREMKADALLQQTLATLARGVEISAGIARDLPKVKELARAQFERVFSELG